MWGLGPGLGSGFGVYVLGLIIFIGSVAIGS